MPTNKTHNKVKHKINGFNILFTADNKWTVFDGNQKLFKGNFKECRKFAVNQQK